MKVRKVEMASQRDEEEIFASGQVWYLPDPRNFWIMLGRIDLSHSHGPGKAPRSGRQSKHWKTSCQYNVISSSNKWLLKRIIKPRDLKI
jgi:hypothetical protein